MHCYSTDSEERTQVTCALALVSGALSAALASSSFVEHMPAWVHAPSALAIFGMTFAFFDQYAWRWAWLRKLGIIKVPDLCGEWKGRVRRTDEAGGGSDRGEVEVPVTVRVAQTWHRISLVLTSAGSNSHSISASLLVSNPAEQTLSYEYLNEPKPDAPDTMQTHRGTAVVSIKPNGDLEGQYYTGRGRVTHGSFKLSRTTPGAKKNRLLER